MSQRINAEEFFSASNNKLIIRDIFAMYHHRWDSIGESVQNAVDSVLKRRENSAAPYSPTVDVSYDALTREIEIADNGVGIPAEEISKLAAPHVSLKNPREATRGEFGVGLTLVAFLSSDFTLTSVFGGTEGSLRIRNGYSWAMDEGTKEELEIVFDPKPTSAPDTSTRVKFKPVRFPEYAPAQLEYVLRRYTAVGDFWSCYKKETGPIKIHLTHVSENGTKVARQVPNTFWHPADFLSEIDVGTIDVTTVEKELNKGKEAALPNWVGFGLIDKDKITEQNLEFTYYALLCRTSYYKQLAEKNGILVTSVDEDLEQGDEPPAAPQETIETVNSGIFISKKGMPLGATIDHPRTAQAGYWRGIFIMMNCDTARTEPGRKKLHVDDEQVARTVAKKIFYRLTKYSYLVIPRDPDEQMESLLRNVDGNIQRARLHRESHKLVNPKNKIKISSEPMNEQSCIALFHEMIGAELLLGYTAFKLSAADTYDGIYGYQISKEFIGKEHWEEWQRGFPAAERKRHDDLRLYEIPEMIVEFKMKLDDVIKDFLQKTKYHPQIKLIVAWDADIEVIRRKGWLLEDLPKAKQKFHGARWRLRPSAEGQTHGILATDVLLLKQYLANPDKA